MSERKSPLLAKDKTKLYHQNGFRWKMWTGDDYTCDRMNQNAGRDKTKSGIK